MNMKEISVVVNQPKLVVQTNALQVNVVFPKKWFYNDSPARKKHLGFEQHLIVYNGECEFSDVTYHRYGHKS